MEVRVYNFLITFIYPRLVHQILQGGHRKAIYLI